MTIDDVIEVSPNPTPGGRRRMVAVAAVVAVLAAGGGVAAWAATRGGDFLNASGSARDPVSCPDTMPAVYSIDARTDVAVPSKPTASGVDLRLVPARAPGSVTLCEYAPATVVAPYAVDLPTYTTSVPAVPSTSLAPAIPRESAIPLGRSHTFTGDDALVTPLLSTLQHATLTDAAYACGSPGPSWASTFLVGLTYDDGVVWVASGTSCAAGATNGVASSSVQIDADAADALASMPSVSSTNAVPPTDSAPITGSASPGGGTTGDPGSGATEPGSGTGPSAVPPADPFASCVVSGSPMTTAGAFVGFTPSAVRICHMPISPGVPAPTVTNEAADTAIALADTLAKAPAVAPDTACPDIGGETWRLLFTDDAGHSASVLVDAGGCRTVSDGARIAQADDALVTLLESVD